MLPIFIATQRQAVEPRMEATRPFFFKIFLVYLLKMSYSRLTYIDVVKIHKARYFSSFDISIS